MQDGAHITHNAQSNFISSWRARYVCQSLALSHLHSSALLCCENVNKNAYRDCFCKCHDNGSAD